MKNEKIRWRTGPLTKGDGGEKVGGERVSGEKNGGEKIVGERGSGESCNTIDWTF